MSTAHEPLSSPSSPSIDHPAEGEVVGRGPEISGTGEPDATVEIYRTGGGSPLEKAEADSAGHWNATLSSSIVGAYSISARQQRTSSGEWSGWAENRAFTVTPGILPRPVISEPGLGAVTGHRPAISGTALPGARVTVVKSYTGTFLGAANADRDGWWTVTPEYDLPEGSNSVSAYQEGKPSGYAENRAFIIQGEQQPGADDHTFATRDMPPLLTDSRMSTMRYETLPPPVISSPEAGEVVPGRRPPISGTGAPGARVTLVQSYSGTILGPAVDVTLNGQWTVTPERDLIPDSAGQYSVTAIQQENPSGYANNREFTVEYKQPQPPVIAYPPEGGMALGRRPVISGTGVPGARVTVVTSYTGTVLGEADVAVDGKWWAQTETDLPGDSYSVSAMQTTVGGDSGYANNREFNVSSDVPSFTLEGWPSWPAEQARLRTSSIADFLRPTGLYLPPRLAVTVTVSGNVASGPVKVWVGTWDMQRDKDTDALLEPRSYQMGTGVNQVTDEIGGMIYLEVEGDSDRQVRFAFQQGVIAAPFFRRDVTQDSDWPSMLENPSPFAELVGNRTVVTVTHAAAVEFMNVSQTELLERLDMIVQVEDDFAGLREPVPGIPSVDDVGPYLYHFIEASHGFAYAGHFRMGFHSDIREMILDASRAGWAVWHELGHQHQQSRYKPGAFTEVTVNLYSLAVERALGQPSTLLDKYSEGRDYYDTAFEKLDDPQASMNHYERLVMFEQLRLAFGDGFWTKLHTRVRSEEAQTGDDEFLYGQLVLLASLESGRNLIDFFERWRITATSDIRDQVEHLPDPDVDPSTLREPPAAHPTLSRLAPERAVGDFGCVIDASEPFPASR